MIQSEFYRLVHAEYSINDPEQTKITFTDGTSVSGFFVTLPDNEVSKEEYEWLFVPALNAIAFDKEKVQRHTITINGENVLSLEKV